MRRWIWRAVGIAALLFVACFLVILGLLVFGDPWSLGGGANRVAVVELDGLIVDAERVARPVREHPSF